MCNGRQFPSWRSANFATLCAAIIGAMRRIWLPLFCFVKRFLAIEIELWFPFYKG